MCADKQAAVRGGGDGWRVWEGPVQGEVVEKVACLYLEVNREACRIPTVCLFPVLLGHWNSSGLAALPRKFTVPGKPDTRYKQGQ